MLSLVKGLYRKSEAKYQLNRAFKLAGLYNSHEHNGKEIFHLPKIHECKIDDVHMRFTFTLNDGIDPSLISRNMYVFQQIFGRHIKVEGELKRFVMKVYPKGLPKHVPYKYDEWKPYLDEMTLPVICGKNIVNNHVIFDLLDYPHLLLSGETGSGKSSLLRVILTSLMLNKSPEQVQFVLGDLKKSEFGIYRGIPHVQGLYTYAKDLKPALTKLKKEMDHRGELLDKAGVQHVKELSVKLPYIILAIDEVVLLKQEKDLMKIIEEIASIGRSLGCILLLSMQRADSKLLDGSLKINLTVRISGRQADIINSKIAGVIDAHEIKMSDKGRMMIYLDKIEEFQSPLLEASEAKKLLATIPKQDVSNNPIQEEVIEADIAPVLTDEIQFGLLDGDSSEQQR